MKSAGKIADIVKHSNCCVKSKFSLIKCARVFCKMMYSCVGSDNHTRFPEIVLLLKCYYPIFGVQDAHSGHTNMCIGIIFSLQYLRDKDI